MVITLLQTKFFVIKNTAIIILLSILASVSSISAFRIPLNLF